MGYLDLLSQFSPDLNRLILSGAFLFAIFIGYKLLNRFISRTGEEVKLEAHAMNAIRLILRVGAIMVTSMFIFSVWDLPTEWFVGSSALIGARAVGSRGINEQTIYFKSPDSFDNIGLGCLKSPQPRAPSCEVKFGSRGARARAGRC